MAMCLLSCPDSAIQIGSIYLAGSRRKIIQCSHCGLTEVKPLPLPAQLKAYYETFHRQDSIIEFPQKEKQRWDKIEQFVSRPGAVLDIGSGTGSFLAEAKSRGWKTAGFELSRTAAKKITKKYNLPVKAGKLNPNHWRGKKFDVITLHSVIEHTPKPLNTLHTCLALLKSRGLLVFSVPNLESFEWHLYRTLKKPYPGFIPEHLHYWTPKALDKMLSCLKVQVLETTGQQYSPQEKLAKRPLKILTWIAKRFLEHTALGGKLRFGNVIYAYARKK